MYQAGMMKVQTLMKEIKDLNACGDIKYSWIRRVSIFNVAVLSKFMYRFNAMPTKFQHVFLKI